MTPHQVLTDARALIADPAHWTQGRFARDAYGNPAGYDEPTAVCFCASAAMRKAGGVSLMDCSWPDLGYLTARRILRDIAKEPLPDFNDTHSHAEVLYLFDKAISSTL